MFLSGAARLITWVLWFFFSVLHILCMFFFPPSLGIFFVVLHVYTFDLICVAVLRVWECRHAGNSNEQQKFIPTNLTYEIWFRVCTFWPCGAALWVKIFLCSAACFVLVELLFCFVCCPFFFFFTWYAFLMLFPHDFSLRCCVVCTLGGAAWSVLLVVLRGLCSWWCCV